jgi:hypothetical protein
MTIYWTVKATGSVVKCDTCKFFGGKKHADLATYAIEGNENAEYMQGQILHLCDKHLQALKEAGEIEA